MIVTPNFLSNSKTEVNPVQENPDFIICPVCEGSGYYRDLGGGGFTVPARVDDDHRLPCRRCNKKGKLFKKVVYG